MANDIFIETSDKSDQIIRTDIVCVGFGPATAGFLMKLSRELEARMQAGNPVMSRVSPELPLQVICYERADDVGFGVSGLVTKGRSIKQLVSEDVLLKIPMSCKVESEKLVYLLDPYGASKRSVFLKACDSLVGIWRRLLNSGDKAIELPFIPGFLSKHDGLIMSIGQFCQWAASELMLKGNVQIWPGTPVISPIISHNQVLGVRLASPDSGAHDNAQNEVGLEIHAGLTVVGDGPVGVVGRMLDKHFGLPENHQKDEWAVGMKVVIEVPGDAGLAAGTVIHTFGYPEPEIFGFLYIHPDNVISAGIFVPSWLKNPVRTSYRYLQYWLKHPYINRIIKDGKIRSWGAKSLLESGIRGEPFLVGNGYARIGEGSGSTNVLSGSGVDEAWYTGVLLAESVLEILDKNGDFTKENLENTYIVKRNNSWLAADALIAKNSRNGFSSGFIKGLFGMALSGYSGGKIYFQRAHSASHANVAKLDEYFAGKLTKSELETIINNNYSKGIPAHGELMERIGWPEIKFDNQIFISHQDALIIGGKVQAPAGYKAHVQFIDKAICQRCTEKTCIEICSGQAIMPGPDGVPVFEREKCVHCGACFWNCTRSNPIGLDGTNIEFSAGPGGLHSSEN